jgi:hypothetical protein
MADLTTDQCLSFIKSDLLRKKLEERDVGDPLRDTFQLVGNELGLPGKFLTDYYLDEIVKAAKDLVMENKILRSRM